jgi:hypothetical protein
VDYLKASILLHLGSSTSTGIAIRFPHKHCPVALVLFQQIEPYAPAADVMKNNNVHEVSLFM